MAVTQCDIAKRAGVTTCTVSHVLGNNKTARISPATRDRIQRIATEMGYRPNRFATSLVRQRTQTIGLLISGLQNPFFVELLETAEEMAIRRGYAVLIDTASQIRRDISPDTRLDGWPIDGALQWTRGDYVASSYISVGKNALPVVYLGDTRDDDRDFVTFDLYDGAMEALHHLWESGRRRIAQLTISAADANQDPRHEAYLSFCAQIGMRPDVRIECVGSESRLSFTTQRGMREFGFDAAKRLAAEPPSSRPDALVCLNDLIAIGAYNGLRRCGVRIPDDIAIMGFDGIAEGMVMEKTLSTVRTPAPMLVDKALEILTDRLGGKTGPARREIIRCELRVGETS